MTRGWGLIAIRRMKKTGDAIKFKDKIWYIVRVHSGIKAQIEAEKTLESWRSTDTEYIAKYGLHGLRGLIHQYEYDIMKRKRTREYGRYTWFEFLVLRRMICCPKKEEGIK